MELIKKKSIQVVNSSARALSRMYITVDEGTIYFTSTISRMCGLAVGLYVNFMNEGDQWHFFINDDNQEFKLTPIVSKNGFEITNSGICKMILKSTGYKPMKRFAVEKTNLMVDGNVVFKLAPYNPN